MIQFDRSVLKSEYRNAEIDPMLEEFADLVAFAKPCCTFTVGNECVDRTYKVEDNGEHTAIYTIKRLNVFENGDELGSIGITTRYSNTISSEKVYLVRSFRIQKERGDRNGKMAKDIKVALRHAKKSLVSRVPDELIKQVSERVTGLVAEAAQNAKYKVRWSVNSEDIATDYAMLAYEARQRGDETVVMPSSVFTNIKKSHDELCAGYKDAKVLLDAVNADRGYGILQRIDNSLVVYSYATKTVKRYTDFDELPVEIQSKYAMFKVLQDGEIQPLIGCKYGEGYFYVVE